MSYDLAIHFPHEAFPYEEWNSILSLFNTEERIPYKCEYFRYEAEWVVVAETRTASKPRRGGAEPEIDPITGRTVWIGSSPVWISLYSFSPNVWGDWIRAGTHWGISLDTSGSASCKAVWTQFAIPYYALGVIEGITVHDPQYTSENSFQDPEAWAAFASLAVRRIVRPGGHDLVKHGLLTEEGKILF
jgi:hypothetical protein